MITLASMNRLIALISALLLVVSVGFSQNTFDKEKFQESLKSSSFREKFEAASSLMDDQLYELSLPLWKSLLEDQPDNGNLNYKYGFCLLRSNENRKDALPYLLKASNSIAKNYDPFDFNETNAPLETEFYLGKAYHHNYELDKAIESFTSFGTKIKKGKHVLSDLIDLHIVQCNNAKVEMASPKSFSITHLSDSINTHFAEFSPVLTLDASALFFTSRRVREDSSNANLFSPDNGKHYDDVYVSYKNPNTNEWGKPQLLEYISRPRSNEATISVSGDGQILFIYKDEDLYFSEYDGEQYGRLQKVGKDMNTDINTDAWETHAALSADGNTMYFVSDRDGGLGGRDIYRAVRLPNGNWSKALNIGPPINTKYDEDAPFFHPDGKTLFFSSNGENSMGGFDIFFTKMDGDGKWTAPINMGHPLNSVDDDIFFVTNTEGNIGYFASAKEEGGFGGQDIYTVEMETVIDDPVAILKGYVVNSAGEPIPPNTYILVTNLTEGGDPDNFSVRKRDGGYVMTLKPCNEYLVEYFADNSKYSETQFLVPCEGSGYHEFGGTLDLGKTGMDSRYHWQIYRNGVSVAGDGSSVNYMNQYGDILYTEPLSETGSFKFHAVEKEIFELKLNKPVSCDKLELALLDDSDKVIRKLTINDGCEVRKDKSCVIGTKLPFDTKPSFKYQILVKGEPLTSGHYVNYMDLTGGKLFQESIGKGGKFTFREIPGEDSYAFEVWMDDPSLCDEMEILVLDGNNELVRTTTIDRRCKQFTASNLQANYQEFFGYNIEGADAIDKKLSDFVTICVDIIGQKGSCTIDILGSASTVPTKKHQNNKNLARKRANKAEKKISKALKRANIDLSKVNFNVDHKVQGPSYGGDASNEDKYGPYQYVKATAK